jgi:hypothetical protein
MKMIIVMTDSRWLISIKKKKDSMLLLMMACTSRF